MKIQILYGSSGPRDLESRRAAGIGGVDPVCEAAMLMAKTADRKASVALGMLLGVVLAMVVGAIGWVGGGPTGSYWTLAGMVGTAIVSFVVRRRIARQAETAAVTLRVEVATARGKAIERLVADCSGRNSAGADLSETLADAARDGERRAAAVTGCAGMFEKQCGLGRRFRVAAGTYLRALSTTDQTAEDVGILSLRLARLRDLARR